MTRRIPLPAVLASLVLALGCGGDGGSGPPPAPAAVVAISANPLTAAAVGSVVAAAPTFEVRSASGRALSGVPVSVAVTAGGGSIANAPTVSVAGPTSIGQWTLGTTAGAQSVTVTVAGIAPLVFTITSQPAAPAQLQVVEGNNQSGTEGQPVPIAPKVRVRDAFGNNVPGVTVNWSVSLGGGTLAATTSVSDAQGIATAPTWTLGASGPGEQRVAASLNALTTSFSAFIGLVPASITVEVAAPATATVGTALATAPAFALRDANGIVISGFPVTVAVTGGGGALASAPTETAAGPTPIGTWTLGTTSGAQTVTVSVSVAGVAPAVFTVQSTAGPVATMSILAGNDQTALAGDFVGVSPTVRLLDQFGNRVTNTPVFWSVTAGSGSLAAAQTTSNGDGESFGPAWRLGDTVEPQQVTADAGGGQAVFNATIQTGYSVVIRYVGVEPTGAVANAFARAVSKIQAVIVGDAQDIPANVATPACNIPGPLNEVVDDVVIYARVENIDGPGGTLGSAGPCYIRSNAANGNPSTIPPLTIYGTMRFDSADLDNLAAQGRLEAVILHEMLHVIGVGTLWNQPSNAYLLDSGQPTVRFTGPLARLACVNQNGGATTCATHVPVENCLDLQVTCGAGTINSHWKESVFLGELMTGFLSAGTNPFSAMTIQSLADMGYQVNVLAANPFTVQAGLQAGLRDLPAFPDIRMPAPLRAQFGIASNGRITPILDQ